MSFWKCEFPCIFCHVALVPELYGISTVIMDAGLNIYSAESISDDTAKFIGRKYLRGVIHMQYLDTESSNYQL